MTKTIKTKKVKPKTVRIWYIHNQDRMGYWSERAEHFLAELANMSPDDKFGITCKDLTEKEFRALEKSSHEFEGW